MLLDQFRKSPWAARLLKFGVVIGILWALAWAVVPGIVKSQLEKAAGERLGRKVSVAAVGFRPWSMEFSLHDVQVADAAGTASQLKVGYLHADVELQSLLRLAPVVDEVRVEGLAVKLTHRGDGRYDVDDILERLAAASAGRPASPPPRFALYNVEVAGGSLDFVDEQAGKTHQIRDLALAIPFLSNLESQRDVLIEPRLAFRLNGGSFDSRAQATPFASSHKSAVTLELRNLDLRPYLPYLPKSLPVRLQAGILGAELRLAFEQSGGKPAVKLAGTVEVKEARLADARSRELLTFQALRVAMDDVRPLEQVVRLAAVELAGPRLELRRQADGRINVMTLAGASPATNGRTAGGAAAAAAPWQVEVGKATLHDGRVHWLDEAISPRARLEMGGLTLNMAGLSLPWQRPARFDGAFTLAEPAPAARGAKGSAAKPARIGFKGEASGQQAAVTADIEDFALALAAPYAAQWIEPALAGTLSAQLRLDKQGDDLQLAVPRLLLGEVRLGQPDGKDRGWPLSWQRLEVQDGQVDLARRDVTLGKLALAQPSLALERGADRRWMFERWLKPADGAAAPAPGAAKEPPPWRLAVNDVSLEGGSVRYADRGAARPVRMQVAALSVQASGLATDGKKPGAFKIAAQVRSRHGDPGKLGVSGTLALQPLAVQGRLQAHRVPLQALSPYLGDVLNVALLRADAGFRGDLRYQDSPAGPVFRLSGDALLEDVGANTLVPADAAGQDLPIGQELLSWKALSLNGLDVALAPGQATRVAVTETALSDFYARVIINPDGRINLQDVVKRAAPAAAVSPAAPASQAAAAAPPALAPRIELGPVSLVNGRINFSDHFIKPNYSADLTQLTGRLGAFSSVPAADGQPVLAELELRGRAEGTASIEILGKLNPLAQPLALDIQGKMRDLELPPLSPYSVKYAGHGIERGKLAMDVSYLVRPDGQLVASNRLVLNQLTFGDPVEGAPASLPVRLAVALLADRNGVIDVDLPISGSLNDPEFRLGAIVFKAIMNLIAKAITAPFSLLASAFGGGEEEAAEVGFPAGSASLDAQARGKLDKIAAMMKERPALQMTVVGTASLEAEREAFRRERLNDMLQAEKRRAAVVAGKPDAGLVPFTAAEQPALLKEVYRRARIPKPRNLIGLLKDLPPADMEALLMASVPVNEEHMRELAQARGMTVKDYLVSRELPGERLFLGALKLVPPEAKWSPRAELQLATH